MLLGYMLMEKIVSCYVMLFAFERVSFAGQFTPKMPNPPRFSSLGHNLQSHDLQLTALIQKCSNKKQYVNPSKNCVPPLHHKFTCALMGQGEKLCCNLVNGFVF